MAEKPPALRIISLCNLHSVSGPTRRPTIGVDTIPNKIARINGVKTLRHDGYAVVLTATRVNLCLIEVGDSSSPKASRPILRLKRQAPASPFVVGGREKHGGQVAGQLTWIVVTGALGALTDFTESCQRSYSALKPAFDCRSRSSI